MWYGHNLCSFIWSVILQLLAAWISKTVVLDLWMCKDILLNINVQYITFTFQIHKQTDRQTHTWMTVDLCDDHMLACPWTCLCIVVTVYIETPVPLVCVWVCVCVCVMAPFMCVQLSVSNTLLCVTWQQPHLAQLTDHFLIIKALYWY